MRKLIVICFACWLSVLSPEARAQDSTLNILKAPNSPAASILGIAPSDVQRPADPAAFAVSLQNATGNLSVFPNSYAVDIAPVWLFAGSKLTYEQFIDSSSVWESIRQSFVLGAAVTSWDDSAGKRAGLGLGVTCAIFRGAVNPRALAAVQDAQNVLSLINTANTRAINALIRTPAFLQADSASRVRMLDSVRLAVRNQLQPLSDSLSRVAENIDFARYGWKLDVAGGISLLYPGLRFNNGRVEKAGIWLTGGRASKTGFSFLGLLRYLYHPDKIFADTAGILHQDRLSSLDLGLRLLYDNQARFTLGGEAIYRSVLGHIAVKPTYRFTINAEYKIKNSQLLTLAIGRDYDGTFQRDGSFIAALNFFAGFGRDRGRPLPQ